MENTRFQKGDPVVLFKGPNYGTPGIFLEFCRDPKWARLEEAGAEIRQHPVEWLQHSPLQAGPA